MRKERSAACECPRCGEAMAADGLACGVCGHIAPPRKSAAQRLAEFAGLTGGLTLVMALCALVARLTGI